MGNVNIADLKTKLEKHQKEVAVLMITYPSTHGVFEEQITDICDLVPFPVADTMMIEATESEARNRSILRCDDSDSQ
jgi:glycine cleavage system protein P-like pyridoxal-binding family